MRESTKKGAAIAALIALFFFATGFGGEPGGGGGTGDDDVPPKPDEPCAPGFHYELHRATLTWRCVANEPVEPLPGVIEDPTPVDPGIIDLPDAPDEPSDDPADWIKPYPGGDAFYQGVLGDQFFGQGANSGSITWRYLATEAHRAAVEFGGLDVAGANAFAAKVANNPDNRRDALNLICCAPYNDACYGTWGYDPDKDPKPALNGRVIRLNPQNPDNRARILNGEPLARCIRVGSPQNKGDGSGVRVPGAPGCSSFELLWLTKTNRQRIWEEASASPSGRAVIEPTEETWPDGSSRMDPPAFIASRGVFFANGSNTANVKVWGCAQIHTVEL